MTSSNTVSLAEIENEYIKCHSWIQGIAFSEFFEADYGVDCCKLDAVATHLSRWGRAMGFTNDSSSEPSTEDCSEKNLRKAKLCLSAINKAFSRASDDGVEFEQRAEGEETNILDSQIQIGKSGEALNALHVALQMINKMRTPRCKTIPSTSKIHLYEKHVFDGLVQTVSSEIQRLNTFFPSLTAEQTLLSSNELRIVKDTATVNILWLKEIVKSNDEFLSKALEQETSSNRDFYRNITVKEKFRGQFGHQFAKGETSGKSSTYENITAGGESVAQFGNTYGYATSSSPALNYPK